MSLEINTSKMTESELEYYNYIPQIQTIREIAQRGEHGNNIEYREYNGKTIEIITCNGYPNLSFFSTKLGYKSKNTSGSEKADLIRNHPEIWDYSLSEINDFFKNNIEDGKVRHGTTTVSTSFNDLTYPGIYNQVSDTRDASKQLRYGYTTPGEIIRWSFSDGFYGQPTEIEERKNVKMPHPWEFFTQKILPFYNKNLSTTYDDFCRSRYDKDGNPISKPDFIIAYEGKINDEMLMHAQYHNIPIINATKEYNRTAIAKYKEYLNLLGQDKYKYSDNYDWLFEYIVASTTILADPSYGSYKRIKENLSLIDNKLSFLTEEEKELVKMAFNRYEKILARKLEEKEMREAELTRDDLPQTSNNQISEQAETNMSQSDNINMPKETFQPQVESTVSEKQATTPILEYKLPPRKPSFIEVAKDKLYEILKNNNKKSSK